MKIISIILGLGLLADILDKVGLQSCDILTYSGAFKIIFFLSAVWFLGYLSRMDDDL